jgi:hypothetical protein
MIDYGMVNSALHLHDLIHGHHVVVLAHANRHHERRRGWKTFGVLIVTAGYSQETCVYRKPYPH